jgi:hypothetical protein
LETLVSYWLTDLLHPTHKFDWRLEPSLSISAQKRDTLWFLPILYKSTGCGVLHRS